MPARLERLELQATMLRSLEKNTEKKPEMLNHDVHAKKKDQIHTDGFARLLELEMRMNLIHLEEGVLRSIENLEARLACLEVARFDKGCSHLEEADSMSSFSCSVVAPPTRQPSLLPDTTAGSANSVSASPKDAVQLVADGSPSNTEDITRKPEVTSVVQEEVQPSSSPHINIEVITPKREVPARLRSIPTPSFLSGNSSSTSSDKPQKKWQWFEQGKGNDNSCPHQGPNRDGTFGNEFPSNSENLDQNGGPLLMLPSLSGRQQGHTISF